MCLAVWDSFEYSWAIDMLRKFVYRLGVLIRNNLIYDKYGFLLKSQYWNISQLQNYQYDNLKVLLAHAYFNSIYYKNKFDKHDFNLDQVTSLADIKKVPVTEKCELLENSEDIQVKNLHSKMFYSETSGSTGNPLVFYRDQEWDAWHNASVFRGFSWHKVQPWEKNGLFWGFNYSFGKRLKTKLLDFLQNQFRVFSYKEAELAKFAKKLRRASYIEGYSSMIYEVAKLINKNKLLKPQFKLKMVKGTSEKIYDIYQDEVSNAFGKKMISEYGAAESGIIAFECEQGKMHINMETCIVEELDNQIVVTNLVSKSFPVIRYKLGDYIEIDRDTKCPCGRSHYIIKQVHGRVGNVIYGKEHKYPSLTLYYVFKNLAKTHGVILNYRAVQYRKGYLNIRIEQKLNSVHRKLMEKEFNKYFGNDLDVELQGEIELRAEGGKKIDFVSKISTDN